jgi:hypothetical protein
MIFAEGGETHDASSDAAAIGDGSYNLYLNYADANDQGWC